MRKFLLCVTAFIVSVNLQAASVWKVSKGDNHIYLGGTLHLLSPSDFPLPEAYDKAYSDSVSLVFETDLEATNSAEFMQQSMQLFTYSDATTLADVLSSDTLESLKQHMQSRGLPYEQLQGFKPAFIGITLSVVELQRLGLTLQGVDNYYFSQASADGKNISWLETPMEQLNFIVGMGAGQEDEMIKYTLADVENMPAMLEQLKADWRSGDTQSMYENSMREFKESYPEIFDDLLVTRNNNWMPKIKSLLATPQTEFVLVGSMHVPGEEGLLYMLEQAGYHVERVIAK